MANGSTTIRVTQKGFVDIYWSHDRGERKRQWFDEGSYTINGKVDRVEPSTIDSPAAKLTVVKD